MKILFVLSIFFALAFTAQGENGILPPHIRAHYSKHDQDELVRIERELAEFYSQRSRLMAAVKAQLKALQPALYAGDFSGLDAASARGDTLLLWYILYKAGVRDAVAFGTIPLSEGDASKRSDRHTELNKLVFEHVRPRLAAIPGHTKMFGELIDQMSRSPGYDQDRTVPLRALGFLGSMESIQVLGRFLKDVRCPEEKFFDTESGMPFPMSNGEVACYAMHEALGAASPLGQPAYVDPRKLHVLVNWWDSESARPYREWKHEKDEPMPPPRKRAAALASPATVQQEQAKSSLAPSLFAIFLAALSILLVFTKLKRRAPF